MGLKEMQILLPPVLFLVMLTAIAIYYARRSNSSSYSYIIVERKLGTVICAMSAQTNDLGPWLLIIIPGMAYWSGVSMAFWTAAGLLAGAYINWLVMAKRLRKFSYLAGNSITLPDFLSARFKEEKPVLLIATSAFIIIFYSIFIAGLFIAGGTFFSSLTGIPYFPLMLISVLFLTLYTLLGGFITICVSDMIKGFLILFSLTLLLIACLAAAGGFSSAIGGAKAFPGFLDFLSTSTPKLGPDKLQLIGEGGTPLFGIAKPLGAIGIISALSCGLGFFGRPQPLIRFMAIKNAKKLRVSRRIALAWCATALSAAVIIGVFGRTLYPIELLTASDSVNIVLHIAPTILSPMLAGIVMTGILTATICSADSFLLINASAFSLNIFKAILKKDATDGQILFISRVAMLLVSVICILLAVSNNHSVIGVAGFAWAGLSSVLGPMLLFSLFWRRCTRKGCIAGMTGGAIICIVWKLLIKPIGWVFGVYELIPAFIISCILIVVFSLKDKPPSDEITDMFDKVRAKA